MITKSRWKRLTSSILQITARSLQGRDDKFVCLMDLALTGNEASLKKEGKLQDQEESDEINACSIVVPVDS